MPPLRRAAPVRAHRAVDVRALPSRRREVPAPTGARVRRSIGPPLVATERLVLRELVRRRAFVASMTDSVADAADWLRRCFERYRATATACGSRSSASAASPSARSACSSQTIDGVGRAGGLLSRHARHRRRGFAVEGAAAVRDWAFARGHDHVIALVREDNLASQAVARKLGMQPGDRAMHAGIEHVVWRVDRR